MNHIIIIDNVKYAPIDAIKYLSGLLPTYEDKEFLNDKIGQIMIDMEKYKDAN